MNKLPRSMRAAILVEQKKPLVIDEVYLPDKLDVGQVLVKVVYSGICGSQIGEIDGVKGEDRFLPHLLGHEGSGVVIATGPGVTRIKKNEKVVMHWRKGEGIESPVPKYKWKDKTLNAGWITTFNEYAIISENRLTVVDENFDMQTAALFGCAITTGLGVIENNAKIRIGESIVVYGAGGVGLNIIQGAKLRGASPIIAIDLYDNRLKIATDMGATHVINANNANPKELIPEILGSKKLDIFIDNTGLPEVIEYGYNSVGPKGKVILVGVPKKNANSTFYTLPLHFGKIITGSHGGEASPNDDIYRYGSIYKTGQVDFKKVISKMYSIDQINDAISDMRHGKLAGRCLIKY